MKVKKSNGRLQKKSVNSDKKSDPKDAMWSVVRKKKSLVEKIRKAYGDQKMGVYGLQLPKRHVRSWTSGLRVQLIPPFSPFN